MHTPVAVERYLGGLVIGQGPTGQPFEVLPWQRRFIRRAFGQPDDAALSLGRGGGRTTRIAGLGAACVDVGGPLVAPNAESVVASSFDQALICVPSRRLVFLRPTLEAHKRRFRVQDSANRATITDRETGGCCGCSGATLAEHTGWRPRW